MESDSNSNEENLILKIIKIHRLLVLEMKRVSIYKIFNTAILLLSISIQHNLFAQNSQFNEPYYWGESSYMYYILDKNVIHDHVSKNIDLYGQPYNGAIVYVNQNTLLSFIVDPFWDRIVYANYHGDWIKSYGEYGRNIGQFNHPRGIATDGLGNLYVADTYNGRIVKLEYDSGNNVIDAGSFSTIGVGILQRPWDLDVDDMGNLDHSDDVIWVVDNELGQVIPFNLSGTIVSGGPITHLYNSSTNTYYNDLSSLCGVAVRKSAAQGYNSTSNRRLYLIDKKLKKLFLVEAEIVENGEGLIYKEKSFNDNVVLSGVESDYFGDVWVVDNANDKIYKYTWDLEYLDEISGLNNPTSVASVRRHQLNMAITERWTNTTGNRTYQHGANIRNLVINTGYNTAAFSFRLTNFNYLTAKVYKNGSTTILEDGVNVSPSGNMSLNWYKSNPSGTYSIQLWARSYDDQDNVYKYVSKSFFSPLKPVTISGSGQLTFKQKYTYTSNTSGGSSENISYRWYLKYKGSSYWYSLGTASTQLVTMTNKSFYLKVKVSSGNESYEYTKYIKYGSSISEVKKQGEIIPGEYSLKNNYPNPFNPLTTIKYDLPEDSFVELFIFDLLGREVRSLIRGNIEAGFKSITWDSKDDSGNHLPSGVYLYLITAKSLTSEKTFSNKKKMVLLK